MKKNKVITKLHPYNTNEEEEVEAICDSTVYMNKSAKYHLLGLFYLIS